MQLTAPNPTFLSLRDPTILASSLSHLSLSIFVKFAFAKHRGGGENEEGEEESESDEISGQAGRAYLL